MIDRQRPVSSPRRSAAVAGAGLAALLWGAGCGALAQDQSAATPKDAIFARKTLMDSIGNNMDELTTMTSTGKIDLDKAHGLADTISVMLMAFPHLFPPATNQWQPNADRDPATDTYAAPDVWTRFADFYKQATATSKSAYDASRADSEAAFRAAHAELQKGCDGCHAGYMKVDP
jgi:cytochrome c556